MTWSKIGKRICAISATGLSRRQLKMRVRGADWQGIEPGAQGPCTGGLCATSRIQSMPSLSMCSRRAGISFGDHQHRNLALAIAAPSSWLRITAFQLPRARLPMDPPNEMAGAPGAHREGCIDWILDVAHNPAGAWALRAGLNALPNQRPRTLIFSCLRDKPVAEMAQILFPIFDQVILAPIHAARAAALDDLLAAAGITGTLAVKAESVSQAIELAEGMSGSSRRLARSSFRIGVPGWRGAHTSTR